MHSKSKNLNSPNWQAIDPWLLSLVAHLGLLSLVGLIYLLNQSRAHRSPVDMVIIESPRVSPVAVTVAKPRPAPEIKSRKIYGVSRKAITADSGIDVKQGNTLAKTPDTEKLKPSDQDSLPIPSEDYLVTEMPRLLAEVFVPYPIEAKKRGVQGVVTMDLLIDAEGKVRKVDLVEGVDPELSLAAVQAAAGFKFRPAFIKDKPVAVKIRYAYRFVIRG